MIFTGPKRDNPFGGWSRTVKVGEQEYSVSMKRGKSVRIPYKPRGENKGYHWYGSVYRISSNSGHVWTDRVPGSLGVKGLLIEAGIVEGNTK